MNSDYKTLHLADDFDYQPGSDAIYPFFKIDHHANAAYVYLTGGVAAARTVQITPSINADYDADGNVIGLEFLNLLIDFGEQFKVRTA